MDKNNGEKNGELHADPCHNILKTMGEHLPLSHMIILQDYLAGFTSEERLLMKGRLENMPVEQFPLLAVKLANASIDKLRSYLGVSVATAQWPFFAGNYFSEEYEGSNEELFKEIDQDENSNQTDGAVIGHEIDNAIEEKTYHHHVHTNETEEHSTKSEVDSTKASNEVQRQLKDSHTKLANDLEKQPESPHTSLALSLRSRLFGDKGVPQEIYDMLMEELFCALYLPGTVIPSEYVNFDGHAYFADVQLCLQKSRLFHDIDAKFYNRYKELYWSQNTWQIQCGEGGYTLNWLHYLPDEVFLKIRRVEMAFSTADSFLAQGYYYVYEPDLTLLENLDNYDREVSMATRDLEDIWFWKLETVSGLRLDHLTLDFTDAFSVEDEFLGLRATMQFHPFFYGMPELKIRAPTRELEELIMAIFVAKNHF